MNGIIRSACSWSRIVRQTSSFCTKVSPSLCRKVDVQVGASLQLNLAQVNVDVDIYTTVDNFEQIEIKSLWKNSNDAPTIFPLVTQQNNCINVDVTTYEAKESLQKFDVVMPGRWCNLSLKGGKGHVTIQSMKEANLGVITNGGSVKLGEVRGNEASIDSKGGIVKASLISAALNLRTGGGLLSLDKVIGTTLQLKSNGGNVTIGSAYGEGCPNSLQIQKKYNAMTHDLCIVSDGGHISIKYLQAKGLAYLSSNGGNVEIQGLDGNATISTNGGNLRLQLLENAKEVKIDSGDGEVTLWMTSEENVNVEHVNDHEKHAKGNLHTEKENVLAGRTEANLQRCNVLILGSGTVVTKKRSWIEAVMQNRSI